MDILRGVIVVLWPAATAAAIAAMWVRRGMDTRRGRLPARSAEAFAAPLPLYRINRRDRRVMLLITAIYAVVAFWGLGDNVAPQTFYSLSRDADSVYVYFDAPTDVVSVRYYTGGNHSELGYIAGYRDADGTERRDTEAMGQKHGQVFHWRDYTLPENTDSDAEDGVYEAVSQLGYVTVSEFYITARTLPLELGELAFIGRGGEKIDASAFSIELRHHSAERGTVVSASSHLLFDEPDTVPERPGYMNSMYFDEIYHVRTAREYVQEGGGVYETTHPPLGKLIISLFIQLFGITPFVWRLPGVICGILMVPLMYAITHRMFGKMWLSAAATLWFAFDFMHFVQTRIATIDSYAVLFSMAMFYFMYVFVARGFDVPVKRRVVPLALCGLAFGLGIAAKWTCFYAGVGICVIYAAHFFISAARARRRRFEAEICAAAEGGEMGGGASAVRTFCKRAAAIIGLSVVFFIIIPAAVYYFSYYFFAYAQGKPLSWEIVWKNQELMWNYHSGLTEPHSYQSSWYQWIINARPILYYLDSHGGLRSAFSAFLNPAVCWAGLLAVVTLFARLYRDSGRVIKVAAFGLLAAAAVATVPLVLIDQAGSVKPEELPQFMLSWVDAPPEIFAMWSRIFVGSALGLLVLPLFSSKRAGFGVCGFILVAYLSQLLPWVLVSRATFNYHYFQCVPFLVLAIAAVFDSWDGASKRTEVPRALGGRAPSLYATASSGQRAALWFTLGALLLFAMFYPALSGAYVPDWYSGYFTRWFFSWVA